MVSRGFNSMPSEADDTGSFTPYTRNKITNEHLLREAVVYLRVSTEKQVEHNQESLRYQRNLTHRAVQLGWTLERTRLITEDLGVSAVYGTRKGFWDLLNDTAAGKIGIIFVFESSRVARKAGDMCALVDAARISGTLIADNNSIYDPRDFTDRMSLYLNGLFSEAEWHQFRMRGDEGRMLQVIRGAYRQRLPTGLIRLPDGEVVKDPDPRVEDAINLVFKKFKELRSCAKVLRELKRLKVKLPRFKYNGAYKGCLVWVEPSRSIIYEIITNPAYAGAFTYGWTQTLVSYNQKEHHQLSIHKPVRHSINKPLEDWIIVQDVYPAYINWTEFLTNRQRLSELASDFKKLVEKSQGSAREGAALLVGIARCGTCGAKMKVVYNPSARYFCDAQMAQYGTSYCPSLSAKSIDISVIQAFFEAIQPSQIDALEAVLAQQEDEAEQISKHLQQRVQRARYEAERTQQQYDQVDPLNRLVAAELERRWEEKLINYQQLEAEYTQLRNEQQTLPGLTNEIRQQLQNISETLPVIWESGQLSNSQKKELLRSLISAVVLKRITADKAEARIAWVSGNCSVVQVVTPAERTSDLPRYDALVEKIKALWELKQDDKVIAAKLTAEGFHSARNKVLLPITVKMIRLQNGWMSPLQKRRRNLNVDGYFTMSGLARHLNVGIRWVSSRLMNGYIDKRFLAPHSKQHVWLIKDDPELIDRLKLEVSKGRRRQGWKGEEH